MNEHSRRTIVPLRYETDEGISHRAAIGLVVLGPDQTIEYEFRKIVDFPGVTHFVSRIPSSSVVTKESLAAVEKDIRGGVETLVPDANLDVLAFGCTSATIVLGEDTIRSSIQSVRPHVQVTTPITAALAAFAKFRAKRIAVLTPYSDDVNDLIRSYIEDRQIVVGRMGSFKEPNDGIVARISAESLSAAVRELAKDRDVDAVFISCTSMRIALEIDRIEKEVGLPVTSSNHALAWHCLRLAGVSEPISNRGRLYRI